MPPERGRRAGGADAARPGGAKRLVAVLAAGLVGGLASAGEATARPETRSLTCREAQDLVKKNGAVTLSTGPNTYDRFVASSRQCGIQGRAANTFVPTRDDPNCRLQTCRGRRSSDGTR